MCVCVTNKIVELAVPQNALCEDRDLWMRVDLVFYLTILEEIYDVCTGGIQIKECSGFNKIEVLWTASDVVD